VSSSTSSRRLPDFLFPFGQGLLEQIFKRYLPGSNIHFGSENDPKGRGITFDVPNGTLPYAGPDRGFNTINPITGQGYSDATLAAKGRNPYADAGRTFSTETLTGPNRNLAEMSMTYLLGGPLAGASRSQSLNTIQGASPLSAERNLLGSITGPGMQRARDMELTSLGRDRALSRRGSFDTMYGPQAQLARGQQASVIRGDMLNSNPWIDATYDRAANSVVDKYRDAVQPGIAAQFARAGSFGGSAHQQNEAISRYGLGRNLEELASGIYGRNYSQERGAQEAAAARQRGFSENMLAGEIGRQYGTMAQGLERSQNAALAERSGFRSFLNAERDRNATASNAYLNRGLGIIPYLGTLRGNEFSDFDRRISIGRALDQNNRSNQDIDFDNRMRRFRYGEAVWDRLQQALLPMFQTTSNTSGNAVG